MPSWWGKSSSKDGKKKENKESFLDTIQRKFKSASEDKSSRRSGGSRRHRSDTISERGSLSRVPSRSPSPSTQVSRCQSFVERPHAQPLPLPKAQLSNNVRSDSGISTLSEPDSDRGSKPLQFLPLPRPECATNRANPTDAKGDIATASISSDSSIDSDDPSESRLLSPLASDCEYGNRSTLNSPSSVMHKDHSPNFYQKNSKEMLKPANLMFQNQILSTSPKRQPSSMHMQNIQIPHHGAFSSAPDSSMSSPSRSPMRAFGPEQFMNSGFWARKPYPDIASAQCSSPGSGHNSGHNSVGGDLSGQLLWQHKCSPECSPVPSPRMTSPGPSSRVHSGAVTPLHPRAGGAIGSPTGRTEDGKQKSHRLPLPPITITNTCPFSPAYSASTSPSVRRSPGRAENPTSPGAHWMKGRLLGRGTFGHVYLGFNSESGEMCAMKEVTLLSDDAKSRECVQQLGQEISLLSRLRHPNIVQYYGTETVDDKLYIYLEYVSGGSIYKLLQEYGQFGEIVIRSYTQQILSGLAYLHAKNTVHRDIKGANILVDPSGRVKLADFGMAKHQIFPSVDSMLKLCLGTKGGNILVDPSGRVKLADFGMAKHISSQSCPLSFKGSPYWMAPEVIKNSNGCNLAVDIWSLGCTVLEMATTKPPWSQYEGVAAMFKIGNSKELPPIPEYLSEDGKNFVRLCLQRNPLQRPTAAQLLEHPFVKNAAPLERPIVSAETSDGPPTATNAARSLGAGILRNHSNIELEGAGNHQPKTSKFGSGYSDVHMPRHISCPVSPIGSPLKHPKSPQHMSGRMSPSPISSPHTVSGSSTPLSGGSGAIPFHYSKQPTTYLHEGIGLISRGQNSFFANGSTPFREPQPHLFQGIPQASHASFNDVISYDNVKPGNQIGHYDIRSILANRVSQQFLKDPMKINPSLDFSLNSPMLDRTSGI